MKHTITLETGLDFDLFIEKYQKWNGKTMTNEQKEKLFEMLARKGVSDKIDGLINKLNNNPIHPDEFSLDI